MPTMPILEDNLKKKKKPIKIDFSQLPPPHITAHNDNGVVGDGIKKKRPKKVNNAKALKALGKRLKKVKIEKEKEKPKEIKEKPKENPLPPFYKPSTEPTIKMEKSKPKKNWGEPTSTPHHFEEPLEHKSELPASPDDTSIRLARRARAKKERTQADTLQDRGVRTAITPLQNKVRQVKAQKEFKKAKEGITKLQSKARQLSAKQKANALKASKELAKEEKEAGEEAVAPLPSLKPKPRAMKTPKPPSGPAPGEKGFWTGKPPPPYTGKGKHPENYRAWIIDNPLAEESLKYYKSPSGKEYLEAHPEIKSKIPSPKPKGRPKKEPVSEANEAISMIQTALKPKSPEAPKAPETPKAPEERTLFNVFEKSGLQSAMAEREAKTPAERKQQSKTAVGAFAKALQTGAPIKTEPRPVIRSHAPLPKKRSSSSSSSSSRSSASSEPPPPSRIIPVAEDAKATAVSALTPQALAKLPEGIYGFKPNYSGRSNSDISSRTDERTEEEKMLDELAEQVEWPTGSYHSGSSRSDDSFAREGKFYDELAKQGSEGKGFKDIKWGSLTQQMNEYKKSHPEIKSLEDFSHHILSNPKEFHPRTIKRANFYKNVIQGKGLMEGDSDSDEEIISPHNIMRPVCLHPALESSTMTMNPGAYNNIKPLMGHLMGEGVGKHIHRLEHNGQTSSHYGPHASHPQMMPQGHYVKHPAMKGGKIEPTMDDLIHQGKTHLVSKFGIDPEQAHTLLHTAIHNGMDAIPEELHPIAQQGIEKGKHLLNKMMGGNFFGDIGHAFKGLGHDIKRGWEKDVAHPVEQGFKRDIIDPTKKAMPEVVHKLSKFANNPYTQGAMAGLSYLAGPEVGIPMSMAYFADRNALDMAKSGRNVTQQINRRYIRPANQVLGATHLGHIKDIEGGKVGKNLGKVLANDLAYLADAGANKLVDLMGHPSTEHHSSLHGGEIGDGLYAQGGKVGKNLGKVLANDLAYLADAGSNKLVDLMGHPSTEHHNALKGKGVRPKGSQEAKDHMAKLRAMRGKGVKKEKKMKGGAMPPPSRSPITDPTLNGEGLYA